MVGQKYVEKKIGHHACLRVNAIFFSLVSLASQETYYSLDAANRVQ